MTKGLPDKSRVGAVSRVRKTTMLGAAAATALISATPSFGADASITQATELQAAIREILRTPLNETSSREKIAASHDTSRFNAISIGNEDDIVVGAGEIAISHGETVEDINLINTGDLTGGVGIQVYTGAMDMADFDSDPYKTNSGFSNYFINKVVYDDAGNVVNYGAPAIEINRTYHNTILNTQSIASRISIDNSGSVNFSGREGISASNKTGESITITNSGDINSTQDTAGRVGIYATTEVYTNRRAETLIDPGELTYNSNGQLTGIIDPSEWDVETRFIDMAYDGGTINIHNTGDIDMGDVGALAVFTEMHSAAIYAKGDGGTTVDNEGDLKVGRGSFGIRTVSQGNVTINNSGNIEIGNASAGISVWRSNGNEGRYRLTGDTYVLNTGDIIGGISSDELEPGENAVAVGMWVVTPGATSEYIAHYARWNRVAAEYNEFLGYTGFTIWDIPNTKLYNTTTINRGRIELRTGGRGIDVDALNGYSDAINEGTIIVGDGTPNFRYGNSYRSAGVYQRNSAHPGASADLSTINAETGIIVTGDDSFGLASISLVGDAITINEGSITTGSGVKQAFTDHYGNTYDRFFETIGMYSKSYTGIGVAAYARNTGSITVGDVAIGMQAVGFSEPLLARDILTGIAVNEGAITTGDNSTGMAASGKNTSIVNYGSITTGDFDLSGFVVTEQNEGGLELLRAGALASSWRYAQLINEGTITVGDGKIGAVARSANFGLGYTASLQQSDTGVITTGDHAVGARVQGNLLSFFASAGEISVGHDSVGVEMISGTAFAYVGDAQPTTFPGALQAFNDGIIETGDHSIGIRMNGVREDIPWESYVEKPDPDVPDTVYKVYYSGTVDVTSPSYLSNSGTIRVGANSTGVEITGTAASDELPQLFNTGTIDAGSSSSTAVRVNAENDIGSFVVNVGTVIGNVTFGAGNDRLTNTLFVDNTGGAVSTGNIVMNGSVIDFGAGDNTFDNDRGMIMLAGGDNLITGANVVMTQGSIEARNNAVDSRLTIDGNLSGDFNFGADFDGSGSDQLIIAGDVADGSTMAVVLNPTQQLSGETTFAVISVGGENNADAPIIDGVTGNFADSVLGAEASYSEETGEVIVTARFGMGHMATSAAAATTMAQQWWMRSVGSLDRRDMQHLVGLEDSGVSVWAAVFQEEVSIDPRNDRQDVSFDQKLSGLQTGIEWKGEVGGGTFSVGPMYSYGNASASQNANLASAMGDATAYGLNAGYRFDNGLYLNAAWQQMSMEIDLRTPGTFSRATGTTDADGDGFNIELGYAYRLQSGLALAPQLQYSSVAVDLDDFTSGDSVYALSGLSGKYSLLRAGLSVFKTFETKNGSITPLVDVSYLDAMDGDSTLSSNGIRFSNDTSGSGYRAEFGVAGRYKAWDITARVGLAEIASSKSALSSNLSVRYRW
jgi:outer membrane autotransporter protein